jgi:demethylmenaquinone methyltransferase/2-methoxy-6-polyprenyl-1,4-benzoquinol methylase
MLEEQVAYYRARAPEYDEWFLRQGRYDRGPEFRRLWFDGVHALEEALRSFRPTGRVLEIACGTGLWSHRLVEHAESLTAVDISPEMLDLARDRLTGKEVEFVQADVFDWRPEASFDVVFFSFWISHVPPDRFAGFWETVRSCLAPGGRTFFIDSMREETSTAINQDLPEPGEILATRRLNDGREYRIVKILYDPDDLAGRIRDLGWKVEVRPTGRYFLHGSASPCHE